jgi:glycosyltransferase involved in cell wall biosynthesis
MRISHVIHTFPPFSRAGSENYCEALALRQARRHAVSVFHRVVDPERPEYEVDEARRGPLEVVRINRIFADVTSFRDTYEAAPLARRFGEYLDRFRPDVVHFHHVTCLSTRCVHEARARGIAVVYTLHDFWLFCPRGQLLRRDLTLCDRHTDADCVRCMAYQLPVEGGHERVGRLDERAERLRRWPLPKNLHRRLASMPFAGEAAALGEIRARTEHVLDMCAQVDRFIAPTRFLRDRYVDSGVPREKILVSDYGFDLEPWRTMPEAEPEPSGRLRAAYLGTWIPSKGVDVLLEAFRGLDPERAVLDVHGYALPFDGVEGYEESLRALAEGAPHIRLHERYEPEDTPRLLAAADVLVVPSIWYENSPLTVHEAFLAGVPAIVSGHGGMAELVRGGGGLTFRPGDAASLRRVLQRVIDDRGLLARLRRELPAVKSLEADDAGIEALYAEIGAPAGASHG